LGQCFCRAAIAPLVIFAQKKIAMPIRNIIFDLGGVFIDIHYHKTRDAFTALGVHDFDAYFQQTYSNPLFALLETGDITPNEFYETFRKETGLHVSNEQIATAWNAMLGDFRPASIEVLTPLKSQYNIYLLSNTNQIHYEAFINKYEQEFGGASFNNHFHTAYYSHLLQLRKPNVACYEKVIWLHGLQPNETLFIDDTLKNIEGAKLAGLQTLHLSNGALLEDVLPDYLAK
jgi:putative hydrolase of the HAD superfamily